MFLFIYQFMDKHLNRFHLLMTVIVNRSLFDVWINHIKSRLYNQKPHNKYRITLKRIVRIGKSRDRKQTRSNCLITLRLLCKVFKSVRT